MTALTGWIRRRVIDTPLEAWARRWYIRLDRSKGSAYDRQTLEVMKRALGPDSNAVDVGAHRGTILREILDVAPNGQHFAFEPLPDAARYLTERFPNAQLFQVALSDQAEEAEFVHDLERPTRSGLNPTPTDGPKETLTVSTDRLDALLPEGVPIHLIKIDTEGAELAVLRGAERTIRAHRPLIIMEHGPPAPVSDAEAGALHSLIVGEYGMKLSLMDRWLKGLPPLEKEAFSRMIREESECYWMAYP